MATGRFLAHACVGDKPTATGNAMRNHRERDEFDIVLYVVLGVIAIAVVMGLIEWNARRNAAAISRELMRPMTLEEERKLEDQMARAFPEPTAAEIDELRSQVWAKPARSVRRPTPTRDLSPLNEGERCINHQRFRRVSNGWIQNGTCG